ncbi:MAG: glucosaminidase domain-containing protein [Kouleothrix sp.]|nr:glucosaminidase domain-containing protein [Kouleothrix sp.]
MSSSSTSRRRRDPEAEPREPMFEVRHTPLPEPPEPLRDRRDFFDELPEPRPRVTRKQVTLGPLSTELRGQLPLDEPDPAAHTMRASLPSRQAELRQAEAQLQQHHHRAPAYASAPRSMSIELPRGRMWPVLLIAAICGLVIWWGLAPAQTIISNHTFGGLAPAAGNAITRALGAQSQNVPPGEHSLLGSPTITAEIVDAVLAEYGSPARGTGQIWIEQGQRYGIDPAYALAFFIHESSAGTNAGWAGLKPGGGSTHNIGNIICAGYATCFGRFRDYASWDEGIEDWYKLISTEYIAGRSASTIERIIPIYAPASDNNDVPNYVQSVVNLVDGWRQGAIQ